MYINPYEILEITDTIEDISIKRLKRKLMLEFDLNNNSTIEYHGANLSKEDILKALDDIEFNQTLGFHKIIFENKTLSLFLHYGVIDFFQTKSRATELENPAFLDFLKPYYFPVFSKALIDRFKNHDYQEMKLFISQNIYIEEADLYYCYIDLSKYLKLLITEFEPEINELIDNPNPQNSQSKILITVFEEKLKKFIQVDCLNALPNQLFDLKTALVTNIYNTAIAIYNFTKSNSFFIRLLSNYLTQIHVEHNLEILINDANKQFQPYASRSGGYTWGRVIFFAALVFFYAIIEFSPSDKTPINKYKFNVPPIKYTPEIDIYKDLNFDTTFMDEYQKIYLNNIREKMDSIYSTNNHNSDKLRFRLDSSAISNQYDSLQIIKYRNDYKQFIEENNLNDSNNLKESYMLLHKYLDEKMRFEKQKIIDSIIKIKKKSNYLG